MRTSVRYKEVAPMTDKISQRPVPPLDPPERFAGGEVVAAARCPVDVSTYPSPVVAPPPRALARSAPLD